LRDTRFLPHPSVGGSRGYDIPFRPQRASVRRGEGPSLAAVVVFAVVVVVIASLLPPSDRRRTARPAAVAGPPTRRPPRCPLPLLALLILESHPLPLLLYLIVDSYFVVVVVVSSSSCHRHLVVNVSSFIIGVAAPLVFRPHTPPPAAASPLVVDCQHHFTSINSEIDSPDDRNVHCSTNFRQYLRTKIRWGLLTP